MGIDYVMQKEVEETHMPAMAFLSKVPHNTWFLSIVYHEDNIPITLLNHLNTLGWTKGPFFSAPPFKGIHKEELGCSGTGLFGDWTPLEKKKNMTNVRKVLRKHGFTGVQHYRISLADCL